MLDFVVAQMLVFAGRVLVPLFQELDLRLAEAGHGPGLVAATQRMASGSPAEASAEARSILKRLLTLAGKN